MEKMMHGRIHKSFIYDWKDDDFFYFLLVAWADVASWAAWAREAWLVWARTLAWV
jgi:hypothetical protein